MQTCFNLLGRPTRIIVSALRPNLAWISRPSSSSTNSRNVSQPGQDVSYRYWKSFDGAFDSKYDELMGKNISSNYVQGTRPSASKLEPEEVWRRKSENARQLGPPAQTYDGARLPAPMISFFLYVLHRTQRACEKRQNYSCLCCAE